MRYVPLEQVCEITMGQAPPGNSYNEAGFGYPLIAGAGDFGKDTPKAQKYTSSPTRLSRKGDIILCIRATIGDTNWSDAEYCLGRGVAGLRPHLEKLDKDFLWHWIGSVKHLLIKNSRGSTFKQVSRIDICSLPFPDISLSEQKRIAAILDKADTIRRKREKAIQLTDEFLRSVFLDMFGDPVTNPKGWERKKIKQLAKVVTGNTPSRKAPENFGSYIEWIKSDNINTPYHLLTRAKEGLSETGEKIGRTVPSNSILVTCIAGTPECIGNTALSDRKVAFNQQINAIVPFDEVDPYFLYMLITISKKIIQSASTNSMKGMVSKGNLQEIELIGPPYKIQKKFGAFFNKLLDFKKKVENNLEEINNLFKSLCKRAFQGEL